MSRIALGFGFSLIALALAGCQSAPTQPNLAYYQSIPQATDTCGVYGTCAPTTSQPYALQENPAAF